jgi:hypothetical protein
MSLQKLKRQGAMHLPRVCACASTPCNCPVPTASSVQLEIQSLSTIQPTSQLYLIFIQLVFSNQSQGISLGSHTLSHFHVYIHSYNFVIKTITQQQFQAKIKNRLIPINLA